MYVKKIKIINYGPIDSLDIDLPFDGGIPKPIVLVGENGSGKSILLSHIINSLMSMQQSMYEETPEIELSKVYKYRSPFYITSGKQYFFGRVDFQNDLYCEELCLNQSKEAFARNHQGLLPNDDTNNIWQEMSNNELTQIRSNLFDSERKEILRDAFSRNCVLYFPPNRFEEPAWLNQKNLRAKAEYMDIKHMKGSTDRKIINYSPLHDNQNWLFEVAYDYFAFDKKSFTSVHALPFYDLALDVARRIFRLDQSLQFGIGGRRNRRISLMLSDEKILVPNIFQFSSGETCLLNLFLSILRDFDLSGTEITRANDIKGIVVVDEIDLHLHAVHQHELLPELIKVFPGVQFIVTTHSPLFVLGMQRIFGQDGFSLYRLPHGQRVSSEEFSEFGSAYQFFTKTKKFSDDVRNVQKPIVFVEGKTDVQYLEKAAELLGRTAILEDVLVRDSEGCSNLDIAGRLFTNIIPQKVILLYDCDKSRCEENIGNVFKRIIPRKPEPSHPLQKGIENLFEKTTLEKARKHKKAFIDVHEEWRKTIRGKEETIPEKWKVNGDEKTNLCNWLCETGTKEDFRHFEDVFNLLEELLKDSY